MNTIKTRHTVSAIAMSIVLLLVTFSRANSSEPLHELPFGVATFNDFLNIDDDNTIDWDRECGPPRYSDTTCVYSNMSEFEIAVNSYSKSTDMPAHSVVVYWNRPDPDMLGSEEAFRKTCHKLLKLLGEPDSEVSLPRLLDYKKSLEFLTERYNFFYEFARGTLRCEITVAS